MSLSSTDENTTINLNIKAKDTKQLSRLTNQINKNYPSTKVIISQNDDLCNLMISEYRFERKWIYNKGDNLNLVNKLIRSDFFNFTFTKRKVNSIYFDDLNNTSILENLYGLENKKLELDGTVTVKLLTIQD